MRATPEIRAQLDASCAAAVAKALDETSHSAAVTRAVTALATAGDGAQVRRLTELAPLLQTCDGDALAHVANLDVRLGATALRALLEQRAREAVLDEWRHGAEQPMVRTTRRVPHGAMKELGEDLVAALRTSAHAATCAPQHGCRAQLCRYCWSA